MTRQKQPPIYKSQWHLKRNKHVSIMAPLIEKREKKRKRRKGKQRKQNSEEKRKRKRKRKRKQNKKHDEEPPEVIDLCSSTDDEEVQETFTAREEALRAKVMAAEAAVKTEAEATAEAAVSALAQEEALAEKAKKVAAARAFTADAATLANMQEQAAAGYISAQDIYDMLE